MKHAILVRKKNRIGMDENGRTPLWHLAARGDVTGVLTALAAPDTRRLLTAMLVTPKDHKQEIVRLLAVTGADPNHKNIYGKSACEVAASLGPHILELLETHSSDQEL